MCEYAYDEYDDYAEPQAAELSGPVALSRPRVVRRIVQWRLLTEHRIVPQRLAFATPFRTGPPH